MLSFLFSFVFSDWSVDFLNKKLCTLYKEEGVVFYIPYKDSKRKGRQVGEDGC